MPKSGHTGPAAAPGIANILQSWGTRRSFNPAGLVWAAAMFGLLAGLDANRVGLFLAPPFGATLTILLRLPDAEIAQPYALIVGSVVGAAVGTLFSLFARDLAVAVLAAVVAFAVINFIHAYHPPGVALALYPILLPTGHWFPLVVVLPFTLVAVVSAAFLSRRISGWPAYPKPLAPPPAP